jgi:hypothetical protein
MTRQTVEHGNPRFMIPNYLGVGYGKHRTTDAQTSCDSAGSSNTSHQRADPLFITGDQTRDASLGESRIRAGEIIGWRVWLLSDGLLHSVFMPHIWRPGVFERATCKQAGPNNLGYHAFKDRLEAERQLCMPGYEAIAVIGSVDMWGEVIEHEYGWRSEYAAVRSIFKITGIHFSTRKQLMLDLSKRYGCAVEPSMAAN